MKEKPLLDRTISELDFPYQEEYQKIAIESTLKQWAIAIIEKIDNTIEKNKMDLCGSMKSLQEGAIKYFLMHRFEIKEKDLE